MWDLVQQVQLQPGTPDMHQWVPEPSGKFSSRSAYLRFFTGSTEFLTYHCLWRAWAPLRAKMFLWLAIADRCWTTDRLARRGLQHPELCPLCDQEPETIQHMLIQCVVAREVWFLALTQVGLQYLTPDGDGSFEEWWSTSQRRVQPEKRKGFNTLVILVSWSIWKQRNRCVFDNAQPAVSHILLVIAEEATLWRMAGASGLQQLQD